MLYIVEVPHQRAPKCWSVNSRDMLVSVANELAVRSAETFDTYEQAAEWLAHDLYAFSIYETAEEALAALECGDTVFSGHGGGKARDALVAQLQKCGEWPEAEEVEKQNTMKPTRVNETGLAYLKSWIEATAAADEAGLLQNTDAKALDAWACDAEEAMANGNPPMVEMPGNVTKSGAPETFTIPADGLHWEEVETQTDAA